jgi:transcriptional activator SPT7
LQPWYKKRLEDHPDLLEDEYLPRNRHRNRYPPLNKPMKRRVLKDGSNTTHYSNEEKKKRKHQMEELKAERKKQKLEIKAQKLAEKEQKKKEKEEQKLAKKKA